MLLMKFTKLLLLLLLLLLILVHNNMNRWIAVAITPGAQHSHIMSPVARRGSSEAVYPPLDWGCGVCTGYHQNMPVLGAVKTFAKAGSWAARGCNAVLLLVVLMPGLIAVIVVLTPS